MAFLDGILPAADPNDPNGQLVTPDVLARRQAMADALVKGGADYSPVQSWTQGLARLAQGLVGGMQRNQLDQQSAAGQKSANDVLIAALNGNAAPAGSSGVPAPQAAQPTFSGSPDMKKMADVIASIESRGSGDYAARGPVTKSGDHAYGRYGVMGNNIPSWTQAAFGKPMSPQEFLANPQAQDAVFQNQFGQYLQKYGNPLDAASVWFTGRPQSQGGNAQDILGTTGNQYVQKFAAALAGQGAGSPATQAAPSGANAPVTPVSGQPSAPPADPTDPPVSVPGYQGVWTRAKWNQSGDGNDVPDESELLAAQKAAAGGGAPSAQSAPAPVGAPAGGSAPVQPAPPNKAALMAVINNAYTTPLQKQLAMNLLQKSMTVENYSAPYQDQFGNVVQRGADGKINILNKASEMQDKTPNSVLEYQFYLKNAPPGQTPMDYATWSTQKARAGATNVVNNVDLNANQTYDKLLSEGIGKSHAALANGVEEAQSRARDLAAMQGAVDAIQKNGGSTGGMGQAQILELQKTINNGLSALGIDKPFDENAISDKEFLTKFNRQIAGQQAKASVGTRVTNFEMSNYLKANPGLEMSVAGNQRLIGIQSQIEQRNIAVGNAIRDAAARAIAQGQKIDPVAVQKIITQYDDSHHIKDPITGQDLTQSYALPEFQSGANAPMAVGHEQNLNGIRIRRVN